MPTPTSSVSRIASQTGKPAWSSMAMITVAEADDGADRQVDAGGDDDEGLRRAPGSAIIEPWRSRLVMLLRRPEAVGRKGEHDPEQQQKAEQRQAEQEVVVAPRRCERRWLRCVIAVIVSVPLFGSSAAQTPIASARTCLVVGAS